MSKDVFSGHTDCNGQIFYCFMPVLARRNIVDQQYSLVCLTPSKPTCPLCTLLPCS
jgi:hypothetical protein